MQVFKRHHLLSYNLLESAVADIIQTELDLDNFGIYYSDNYCERVLQLNVAGARKKARGSERTPLGKFNKRWCTL